MISTPTVFVLGAGASMPYGLPSGKDLVTQICQASAGVDFAYFRIDPDRYSAFASELRASKQASVDAFLEHRKELQEVGKKAIAYYLIQAEKNEALFAAEPAQDWYSHVVDRITTDTTFDELTKNQVGFITFNYDRSLEQFLFKTISARYGRPFDDVQKVVSQFKIIHVHGRLGFLPWQSPRADDQRPYEPKCTSREIEIAAKGIKIISEDIDGSAEFAEAQELMKPAKRVAILGFGYHPVNMRRLKVPFADHRVFGTCVSFTTVEIQACQRRFPGLTLIPSHVSLGLLRNVEDFQD
jgi:hypothetical protein